MRKGFQAGDFKEREMNIIRDEALLAQCLQELNLKEWFDLDRLHPRLCRYEKGELLTGPNITQRYLLFLVSGVVKIYGIGLDGRQIPVNLVKRGSLIGDVEFCSGKNSQLFSEVEKEVLCVGFPVYEDRQVLENDIQFLHYLLKEISSKVYLTSTSDTMAVSVEERLLVYLEEECENQTLTGIEHACMRLQCSRRQLQRVLSELCRQGEIEKIGRGTYRLTV